MRELLYQLRDPDYGVFQAKLVPEINPERILGVRVPALRALAKQLLKSGEYEAFLKQLPHEFYDENMLHGLILSELKNDELCMAELKKFLPYVDNWAVCDALSPGILRKNREQLLPQIRRWTASEQVYTCRFGMKLLMSWYLDDGFLPEYLELPAGVKSEAYYVRMMIAWFFATALAKQWEAALPYLEEGKLDRWTHNKTIRKAIESYRITPEQKAYLRTLKR